ncbi:MAG: GNAT family N-acetyltransferase [Pseudomonadota bacterium]
MLTDSKQTSVEIADLIDYPSALETVVSWIDTQWASFSGRSLEETRARYTDGIIRDQLPITLIALSGDEILGLASLRERDSFDFLPGKTPWICNVYVDQKARGKGIAGALCKGLEKRANLLGYTEMFLATVMHHNSLYHRLGFKEVAQVEAHGDLTAVLCKEIER